MLGNKVKKYRKSADLTIKMVAESTGLSIGYISQVENGQTEPSLSSLRKLSKALDVPIYLLLDYEEEQAMTIKNGSQIRMHNHQESVTYEFLSPLPSQGFLPQSLMIHFTIKPHTQDAELPVIHHSEEIVTVLSGSLTIQLGEEEILLNKGDTSLIKEDIPHLFINNSDEPVDGISSLTPPVWGNMSLA